MAGYIYGRPACPASTKVANLSGFLSIPGNAGRTYENARLTAAPPALGAHGFGVTTRYGHLSEIGVQPGQRVHRGDLIGRVGNTGRSTGSHLHYEVRLDGTLVNPLAYILDDASGPS